MSCMTDTVLRSAIASKLAYSKDVTGYRETRGIPVKIIEGVGERRAHAFVWETGSGSRLVCFRGSTKVGDILRYVDPRRQGFAFCEKRVSVHRMVYDMFEGIEGELNREIEGAKGAITFCGHSLGGALAMFAAPYYSHMMCRGDVSCHTFGAPKVGDVGFRGWYDEKVGGESVHLKNPLDVVPMYPCFYGDVKGGERMEASKWDMFKDHDMDTYLENIRNEIERVKVKGCDL